MRWKKLKGETTHIRIYKADKKLLLRIMPELDCATLPDLIHKFVQSYYDILRDTLTVELEIEAIEDE